MNRKTVLIGAIALLMSHGSVWAQENDVEAEADAEATIRLMGAADAVLPDAVINDISLPEAAEDSAAVENAKFALETANANRMRREAGLATADDAREKGAAMAEEAMQNSENRGRSEERPDVPQPPTSPGPPGGA